MSPADVAYEERLARPTSVYQLLDCTGEIIYIGMTADLPRRLREHSRKSWAEDIAAVRSVEYPDRHAAGRAEDAAIIAHLPRGNQSWRGRSDVDALLVKRAERNQLADAT